MPQATGKPTDKPKKDRNGTFRFFKNLILFDFFQTVGFFVVTLAVTTKLGSAIGQSVPGVGVEVSDFIAIGFQTFLLLIFVVNRYRTSVKIFTFYYLIAAALICFASWSSMGMFSSSSLGLTSYWLFNGPIPAHIDQFTDSLQAFGLALTVYLFLTALFNLYVAGVGWGVMDNTELKQLKLKEFFSPVSLLVVFFLSVAVNIGVYYQASVMIDDVQQKYEVMLAEEARLEQETEAMSEAMENISLEVGDDWSLRVTNLGDEEIALVGTGCSASSRIISVKSVYRTINFRVDLEPAETYSIPFELNERSLPGSASNPDSYPSSYSNNITTPEFLDGLECDIVTLQIAGQEKLVATDYEWVKSR